MDNRILPFITPPDASTGAMDDTQHDSTSNVAVYDYSMICIKCREEDTISMSTEWARTTAHASSQDQ